MSLWLRLDFERWLFAFGAEVEKMTVYQKLRVTRITTPNKICGGMRCLLVNSKRCPVALGNSYIYIKLHVKIMEISHL